MNVRYQRCGQPEPRAPPGPLIFYLQLSRTQPPPELGSPSDSRRFSQPCRDRRGSSHKEFIFIFFLIAGELEVL